MVESFAIAIHATRSMPGVVGKRISRFRLLKYFLYNFAYSIISLANDCLPVLNISTKDLHVENVWLFCTNTFRSKPSSSS